MYQLTLGSLFDGSGGFPLAGIINGITPVWASEIEPYPMRVTAARLPEMKQLGDVTQIKGSEIAPVDIITFGSPCQDLSVAGKQQGISDYTALCVGNGQMCNITMKPVSNTLDCMHDQQAILTTGRTPRKYIVRRLTPLECCRLQGFPDWWEDDVEGSDSARYKMWGNGIALPCAADVLNRIAKEVEREGKEAHDEV